MTGGFDFAAHVSKVHFNVCVVRDSKSEAPAGCRISLSHCDPSPEVRGLVAHLLFLRGAGNVKDIPSKPRVFLSLSHCVAHGFLDSPRANVLFRFSADGNVALAHELPVLIN